LGVHPERDLVGVDFTTGSLGHGLSFAAGAALAARLDGSPRRTYALLSDAECNEGAVWEAAMFAAHHRLCNLTAVIDCNGQQALGKTADVLQMEPQTERWQSFGWRPIEVDGHDPVALQAAFADAVRGETPSVVLARTSAGKGVSFMEDKVEWHYLPMTDEQYASALNEVAADR
jgi:transketolase